MAKPRLTKEQVDEAKLLEEVRKAIQKHSATWEAVARLATYRARQSMGAVARTGLPMLDTENHRGRLVVLRELLSLTNPKAKPDEAEVGFDAIGGDGEVI
jgi:hypothetical protein